MKAIRAVAALLALVLCGCAMSLMSPAVGIPVTADSISLSWDPPAGGLPGMLGVSSYRIYYRPHDTLAYTMIAEVPASSGTSYQLSHAAIGDGQFDFAVAAINGIGLSSDLHESVDWNAAPMGGWYIIWINSRR